MSLCSISGAPQAAWPKFKTTRSRGLVQLSRCAKPLVAACELKKNEVDFEVGQNICTVARASAAALMASLLIAVIACMSDFALPALF